MKAFVIDISRCNGCYCCQIACKDEHAGRTGRRTGGEELAEVY